MAKRERMAQVIERSAKYDAGFDTKDRHRLHANTLLYCLGALNRNLQTLRAREEHVAISDIIGAFIGIFIVSTVEAEFIGVTLTCIGGVTSSLLSADAEALAFKISDHFEHRCCL